MSRLTDDEAERYQRRMSGVPQAAAADPMYQFQTTWLRSMLDLVDMVMEDEGVAPDVRRKVVRGVLYGSPNVADAELRVGQQEAMVRHLSETPAGFTVTADCPVTPLYPAAEPACGPSAYHLFVKHGSEPLESMLRAADEHCRTEHQGGERQ